MRAFRSARWILAAAFAAAPACSRPAPASSPVPSRVYDLGHPLSATDPSWDGSTAFAWSQAATFEKDGYFAGRFATEEHFGTHVDAPAHFAPGGMTVDQIPADRLVRPAVVIDITAAVAQSRDYRLTVDDIAAFEKSHGVIAEGTAVLVATGWDQRWPNVTYMNEAAGVKHFPGISVDAANLLARTRKVAAIGIDTPSIDYGPSAGFEAHHATMPAGVYHIENLTGLTSLPATGLTLVVAPVKIAGGSGAPARVFAWK